MKELLLTIEEGIAYITLNRPEKYNSVNRSLALAFQEALDTCAKDDSIRCLVITAAGKAFCAGQDLAETSDIENVDFNKIIEEHYNPIVLKMRALPKPIICAVNGVAAGAGANIALAADIVVATESASFIQAFSKIGLIPDSGGTFFLPRLIGMQRAAALMFLGEKVSALEAADMGMIYKCFADNEFELAYKNLAAQLAAMPTAGLGLTKQLLNESWSNNLEQQLAREKTLQIAAGKTHDFAEGVTAFLEKRKASFKGQ